MIARVRGFPTPAGALDVDVAPGDVVLLRGPNGSGKTSLLRALAGLDSPVVPASVEVEGVDPRGLPARALRASLAAQDARDALVGLTVRGEFRVRGLDAPVALVPWRDRDVATLSSGEARRVALSVAAVQSRRLLLVDEPVEGLDAASRALLAALVREVGVRGAVVIADHSGDLASHATRVVDLAPHDDRVAVVEIPRVAGPALIDAPATSLVRDGGEVRLPAVRLGPGFHVVVGPNGSGKSTLLQSLARLHDAPLLPARSRDVLLGGSVAEELAGLDPRVVPLLVPGALHERHPCALSGGEAQRVALAVALARPSRVVLLDEPEAHLDAAGRRGLVDAVRLRVAEGACVVAATHDERLMAVAHDVVRLEARA